MLYHLLLFRSLTQTQMAGVLLDRAGLSNRIVRVPKEIAESGCGHCIRMGQGQLDRALSVLTVRDLKPKKIYVTVGEKSFEEVML